MKIPAIRVELGPFQLLAIEPMMQKVREAADAGKPGFLCAQIHAGEMRVFFIDHERALKFQAIMGSEVGGSTADKYQWK